MSETVLLLGSGSREHALAWKLVQSSKVKHIDVAPGNGGIATMDSRVSILDIDIKNVNKVVEWCRLNKPSLVVIGPEDPLDRGISDGLSVIGVPCFGPGKGAAQIECDKSFAKDFMRRHDIPTAKYQNFTDANAAKSYVDSESNALVIKASGLAAGKGVIVANNKDEAFAAIDSILLNKSFGDAGTTIVVEELLEGDEVSVLAFTDGNTYKSLLPSQDHKRAFDFDKGPNTGGMGAYCPYPFLDDATLKVVETEILQKTIDGLRQEGRPFVGLLYAGLMLTRDGPKVIEFNCRFGDPETQSILPLLQSDLYDVCFACTQHKLDSIELKWTDKSACGVVIASQGYPDSPIKGKLIRGLVDAAEAKLLVFHGGTQYKDSQYYTSGGRVLSVVAVDNNLESAANRALKGAELINIDNCFYRKDIARKAINRLPKSLDYKTSGVDIIAGEKLVNKIKGLAAATKRSGVMDQLGGFGALFDLKSVGFKDPILISGTDGVGTKLRVALDYGRLDSVGIDLVAMCVNDILVQGAQPLFFLDYYACSKLDVNIAANVIEGIARGCQESNCALVGGETAEMPGMYADSDFDLAGFAVGAVERTELLPRTDSIQENDVVIGIPSSGVHSNGFSLVRKILETKRIKYTDLTPFDSSVTFGDVLLNPTKLYVKALLPVLSRIKALAHITGGGLIENIPRILPKHLAVELDASKWKVHDIFKWLQAQGNVNSLEMLKTFNCGLGMVCIVNPSEAQSIIKQIGMSGESAHVVGVVRHRQKEDRNAVIVNNYPLSRAFITPMKKKRVAVLLSGSGTNFQAIADYVAKNRTNTAIELALVISDKKNAEGVAKAKTAGITIKVVIKKKEQTREEYDDKINDVLKEHSIDLVCLAGYMRLLSDQFVNKWVGKIINIHPSLLPLFKGKDAYKQALDAKVRLTGCTVHFVTPEMDAGPIIAQQSVPIEPNDTENALQERGKRVEHQVYPNALEMVAQEKVVLSSDATQAIWI